MNVCDEARVFVVESKDPDSCAWEPVAGAGASLRRQDAEEELRQDRADNPGKLFRVAIYTRVSSYSVG
jgi:hypothetical protein